MPLYEKNGLLSSEETSLVALHPHCLNCYSSRCAVDGSDGSNSCPLISCTYCSVRLHQCKREDHELVCGNGKVNCINAWMGCTKWMRRNERGKHLEHCPASVIRCSLTWCRQPISAHFEGVGMHLNSAGQYGNVEQPLDVALLLRDLVSFKRQSGDSSKVERTFHKSKQRTRYLGDKNPQHQRIVNGAEAKMVCALCMCKSKRPVSSSNDADATAVPKCYSAEELEHFNAKLKAGVEPKSCKSALVVNLKKNSLDANDNKVAISDLSGQHTDHIQSANFGQASNHSSGSTTLPDADLAVCTGLCTENGITSHDATDRKDSSTLQNVSLNCQSSNYSSSSGAITVMDLSAEKTVDEKEVVPFDIYFEYPTRLNDPHSPFQFPCGQLFRRDEYCAHVRNVHVDTLTQLGWCEQRCPLAYRGCTFVLRRLVADGGRTARFLPAFDCVAVRRSEDMALESECGKMCDRCGRAKASTASNNCDIVDCHSTIPSDELRLTDLPIELLVMLFGYLDPLSLRSLSATCSSLRTACSILIADRGCVTPVWYPQATFPGSQPISTDRWKFEPGVRFFSNAFERIDRWRVQDAVNAQISTHLRTCTYNERSSHDPRSRFVTDELRSKVEKNPKPAAEATRERNPFVNTLQRFLSLSERT